MLKRLNHWWRVVATGISFLLFGLGGLLISLLVYPLLVIFTNKNNRYRYGQLLIHCCFKAFIGFMRLMGIFSLKVNHEERLNQKSINQSGLFLVANHPTLIDVVIILSLVKQCDCVVKGKLFQNMFTKRPLMAAGYIENNHPEDMLTACVNNLQQGRNLLVFPEGTRTKNLQNLKLKRGAALIALKSGHNMLPITIECTPRILAKGQKWYKIPHSKPHFTITVGTELNLLNKIEDQETLSIQSRQLNQLLHNYYTEELKIGKINH